jgi:hypothetical protein
MGSQLEDQNVSTRTVDSRTTQIRIPITGDEATWHELNAHLYQACLPHFGSIGDVIRSSVCGRIVIETPWNHVFTITWQTEVVATDLLSERAIDVIRHAASAPLVAGDHPFMTRNEHSMAKAIKGDL